MFAAGFLNQVGKGPHFSLRFGAISLAVVASFPAMSTLDYVYWGMVVLISLASRIADHLINGPLHYAGPWLGAGSFDRWGWVRLRWFMRLRQPSVYRRRVRNHSSRVDFGHYPRADGA